MPKIAKCGTRSGYNRHLRLKEEVCQDCRDAQNEYDRKRFYENPELKRIRNRKHSNPEKKRSSWRRREAKRRGSFIEKYLDSEVLQKYGTKCYICKTEIDLNASRRSGIGSNWEKGLNIDHVIPISLGGSDTLENVRPTHVICNIKKGNKVDKTDNP
jgi:5-methylcytosine-specific restriction endonuclease McrA